MGRAKLLITPELLAQILLLPTGTHIVNAAVEDQSIALTLLGPSLPDHPPEMPMPRVIAHYTTTPREGLHAERQFVRFTLFTG